MSRKENRFYGEGLPYLETGDLTGSLIVIEGTDGVGRSTQIEDVKRWLEVKGHAVVTTGWTQSQLMKKTIDTAKAGHTLNVDTFSLLYAADFSDRLEHDIISALKAGFIVLADRYVYTAFARAVVRGASRDWIRRVYGFALKPDIVFYMRIGIEDLIPRVINSEMLEKRYWKEEQGEGIDYWESGMDLRLGEDFYDSFVEYQRSILVEFDAMTKEYGFTVVDASKGFEPTNKLLKKGISRFLSEKSKTKKNRGN